MKSQKTAWDRGYRRMGKMWRGAPEELPLLPKGSRVLELGCGNGKTLSAMLQKPWEIHAVDFAPGAVLLGIQAAGKNGNVWFHIADAGYLPFRADTFDAVFAIHLIGHMTADERVKVSSEIVQVLKPGGKLYLQVFSRDDMRYGNGVETEDATYRKGTGVITHYFTKNETENLFSDLIPESVTLHSWKMRVMGKDHTRSVINATFVKVSGTIS